MLLEGKGLYIWKVHHCEGGDPGAIVRRAREAALTHVLIKIADGPRAYNVDLAERVVEALKGDGIQVWGWQFVYGNEPFGEADIAVHRIRTLGLSGFVINAEADYKGKYAAADAYVESLVPRLSDIPVALSSFRYPHYHPEFPWTEFLSGCDFNMPQVYWVQADNPVEQLDRCVAQFQDVYPVRPIVPTGAAYEEFGWRPKTEEIVEFLRHARDMGLPAANFWSWDYVGSSAGEDFWHVIAGFHWPITKPPRDVVDMLADAMNRGDVEALVALYQPNAVLVTPQKMFFGCEELREYYTNLLRSELPGAVFGIEQLVNEGYIRHVRWDASGTVNGRKVEGSQDTLGLRQGLIQYHSSIYKVT
jgi:ketosteroid isomerase-like protein